MKIGPVSSLTPDNRTVMPVAPGKIKAAIDVVSKLAPGHRFYVGGVEYIVTSFEPDGSIKILPCGLTRHEMKKIRRAIREDA